MKIAKKVVWVLLLALMEVLILSGCGTPITPTLDLQGTIEAAAATAVASQPTPDATATYAAIATEIAATQAAQAEPTATPTPVLPAATPESADTPTVGPIDTTPPTDTPAATLAATTQTEPTATPTPMPPTATPKPTDTPVPPPSTPTATPTNTPTPMPTLCVIGESRSCCTDNGGGKTEIIPVEPPRTVDQIRIDLEKRAIDCGFSLWEVEIYGPDTGDMNLAIGATPTASSFQDSFGCEGCFPIKAVDGDMKTRWSSDWFDEEWFEINLSMPQVVNRIVLIWETAYAKEYCVTVIEP